MEQMVTESSTTFSNWLKGINKGQWSLPNSGWDRILTCFWGPVRLLTGATIEVSCAENGQDTLQILRSQCVSILFFRNGMIGCKPATRVVPSDFLAGLH